MELVRYVCVPSIDSHTGELDIEVILGDHIFGFEHDLKLLGTLLQMHFKSAEFALDAAYVYSEDVLDYIRPSLKEDRRNHIQLRCSIVDGKQISIVDCVASLV